MNHSVLVIAALAVSARRGSLSNRDVLSLRPRSSWALRFLVTFDLAVVASTHELALDLLRRKRSPSSR